MSFFHVISLLALAYILWLPVSNNGVLYPVLAVLAISSILVTQRGWLAAAIVGGTLLVCILLMFFVGNLRSNYWATVHAINLVPTLVVWTIWSMAQSPISLKFAIRTILIVSSAVSASIVLMVGADFGWLPPFLPEWYITIQNGFTDVEDVRIRFYALSTLVSAVPLAIAGLLLPSSSAIAPRWMFLVAAILGVAAAWFGGRRAIAVVVVLAPILVLICATFFGRVSSTKALARALLGGGAAIAVLVFVTSSSGPIGRAFSDAFSTYAGDAGTGEVERSIQASELAAGWTENIILGEGLGATLSSGFFRNAAQPWMFESQYQQLLFNGGIIAALIVCVAVAFVGLGMLRATRNDRTAYPYAVLSGVTGLSVLIANQTNPYLLAPGHGWMVALPLGVLVAFWSVAWPNERRITLGRVKRDAGSTGVAG